MGYFVTGATGFIGRNLVELLLEREGTIYVLVREGSQGRLAELRNRWGVDEEPRRRDRRRSLPAPPRRLRRRLERLNGEVDHLFHLAAIYDMKADAESQRVANVEGTRHMVAARRGGRGRAASTWSARSPPPGSTSGTWREDMFDEAQNLDTHPYFRTKHESERVVREECKRPWRVYRPGIVVGNSETGEMDKIDGPYYFFKLIRRIRQVVPAVDADARASRAARSTSSRSTSSSRRWTTSPTSTASTAAPSASPTPTRSAPARSSTSSPAPPTRPQSTVRAPASATEALAAVPRHGALRTSRSPTGSPTGCSPTSASRARCCSTSTTRPTSTRAGPRRRWPGTGITVPPLEAYAGKLWDYWARHLDPDLYRDRTLVGAARGRAGLIGGLAQILEQQIPDELMRFGRRLQGNTSLEKAVSGKVVMVTGASSGIGKSAALKIADAGGIVLLVARTPEKLEETRDQIERRRRDRPHPPLRPLRRRRHRPDVRRGARAARPRRRADQQRRPLDPALDRALLRPLPRLRADDAAQLLRPGAD